MRTLQILHKATATLDTYRRFIRLCAITHPKLGPFATKAANMAVTPYFNSARYSIHQPLIKGLGTATNQPLIKGLGTATNQQKPRIRVCEGFVTASQPHHFETLHEIRQWQTKKSYDLLNNYLQILLLS
jgi:hypothetical protein